MTSYIVCAVLACLIAFLTTPWVCRVAIDEGRVDLSGVDPRKVHTEDTPRLGGIVLLLAFYTPVFLLIAYRSGVGRAFIEQPKMALGLLGGGLIIAGIGLIDDLRGLNARQKFFGQFAVALLMLGAGFRAHTSIFVPLGSLAPVASSALTVIWIVGVINAFNLIDGLDGLASGIAFLSVSLMMILAILNGAVFLGLVCCTLAGALLGFLYYNFHPASIFLGDSGSMFLGFLLSVASIQSSHKSPLVVALLIPLLALGLPIMDVGLAISRRALHRRSLFSGDAEHIHHRLLRRGWSYRSVVIAMYAATLVLCLCALSLVIYHKRALAPVLLTASLVIGLIIRGIGKPYLDGPSRLSGASPECEEPGALIEALAEPKRR